MRIRIYAIYAACMMGNLMWEINSKFTNHPLTPFHRIMATAFSQRCSMNGQVGTLEGQIRDNVGWKTYLKESDATCPTPSTLWMFCDETMYSLNDGYLQMDLSSPDYPDVSAAYDNHGNTFSFIDGHVEWHKWMYIQPQQGLLACPYQYNVINNGAHWPSSVQDVDYSVWLRLHTACKDGQDFSAIGPGRSILARPGGSLQFLAWDFFRVGGYLGAWKFTPRLPDAPPLHFPRRPLSLARLTEKKNIRVVVGMSGGVDSSAAAALLLEQGYDVVGITLKLWPQDCVNRAEDKCCGPQAVMDARSVSHKLNIPYYLVDEAEDFQKQVINYFAEEYKAGRTPNPCVMCNEKLKFGTLISRARQLGAQYIATGHFARVEKRKWTNVAQRADATRARIKVIFFFHCARTSLPARCFRWAN